jgi:hypothetical protein
LVLLFIFLKNVSFGQTYKFNFGFYTNLTHAKWKGDIDKFCTSLANEMNSFDSFSEFSYDVNTRTGANIGFIFNYNFYKTFYLQSEISYMMKGTVINGEGKYQDGWYGYTVFHDVYMKQNYLEIPLLLKIYVASREKEFGKPRGFNLYFIGGPSIGFALAGKMETVVQMGGESATDTQEYEGFNDTDFGLDYGIGFEIAKYLDIEFRYQKGLKSIFEDQYDDGLLIKNGVFTWGFACTFPIK